MLLAPFLRCCHHTPALPLWWQLYQRRATLGSKQLCHSFKGEQAADQNSRVSCWPARTMVDARLCEASPSLNQTVASSDIRANEQSLTSISAVFVTSTIRAAGFSILPFHQFYFNPLTWQGGIGPGEVVGKENWAIVPASRPWLKHWHLPPFTKANFDKRNLRLRSLLKVYYLPTHTSIWEELQIFIGHSQNKGKHYQKKTLNLRFICI